MSKAVFIAGSALALSAAGIAFGSVSASSSVGSAPAAQILIAKFAVANMTCPTCPITVRKAMQGVAGVRSVAVDLRAKTATVAFDPLKANVASIAAASANAGFPATPVRRSR